MSNRKHLLSAGAVALFFVLALASKVNKLQDGPFQYGKTVEEKSEQNYVVKNDGTKVYGTLAVQSGSLFEKQAIIIDDQPFAFSELKGYYKDGVYYARNNNVFLKRIVHGKINVYAQFVEATFQSSPNNVGTGGAFPSTYSGTNHYWQKGENGKLVPLTSNDDIKQLVADCPLSLEMINKSKTAIKKERKTDPGYMNRVFEIYNNDCKPVP